MHNYFLKVMVGLYKVNKGIVVILAVFLLVLSGCSHSKETHIDTTSYQIDYENAEEFEAVLNSGSSKTEGKVVQFEVLKYAPDSALGHNCWAGEHLNFISVDELTVNSGDIIVGRISKEPSKTLLFGSWKIEYEVLDIIPSDTNTEQIETTVATGIVTEPKIMPSAEIERISFDNGAVVVGAGRTAEIPFVLYPENASSDTLEVSVDNTEIATVSLDQKDAHILQITGVLPGEVTLILKSGETITATKTVTIAEVMPEEITITSKPQPVRIGSSGNFTANFEPQDVTNRIVVWESVNPNVIRVNEDGSYDALSVGIATITATHNNGITGTAQVEVLPIEVETITLSTNWDNAQYFCKNSSMTLTAEIKPENATEKALTWYSSDESVATVSDKGVVKAISPGTTTITAEAINGITTAYEITVDISPQKFRVSASIFMQSNDHVGNNWTSGFEFNNDVIRSGSTVSIMPGETFTVCGWAQDNDSKPDYGSYWERLTLTEEMCQSGFSLEGNANVYENGGRYSGNCAIWHVKITFTPIN